MTRDIAAQINFSFCERQAACRLTDRSFQLKCCDASKTISRCDNTPNNECGPIALQVRQSCRPESAIRSFSLGEIYLEHGIDLAH